MFLGGAPVQFVVWCAAEDLPDLDECRNKGIDVGEGVARAACLSLILRCPLAVRKAESFESIPYQRASEVLQGTVIVGGAGFPKQLEDSSAV